MAAQIKINTKLQNNPQRKTLFSMIASKIAFVISATF
jgi:hypothetical protein